MVPMWCLAETLGSVAGAHVIDLATSKCLGQEVSASHLRPVSSGLVTGIARPIHLGRRSHVWEIRLEDDRGKLTCLAKLILAIIPSLVELTHWSSHEAPAQLTLLGSQPASGTGSSQ